jgi:hypothetical protein
MIKRFIMVVSAAGWMFAQPSSDKMMSSSIGVFGTVTTGGKREARTRGGGFALDSRHVITNLDTCCGKTEDGQQLEPVVTLVEKKGGGVGKVVWSAENLHIAILELSEPIDVVGVSFAPVKLTQPGQPVYSVQLADPNDKDSSPKMTEGKIQDVVKFSDDVLAYKTTMPMVPLNAGGALFDACGNVIGVNLAVKDGVQLAFAIDPALQGAQGVGLQASVTDKPCSAGGAAPTSKTDGGPKRSEKGNKGETKGGGKGAPEEPSEWRLPKGNEWIPVILLIGVASLAFRRTTRQQVVRALTVRRQSVPEPAPYPFPAPVPAVPRAAKPALRGIAGQYAGESVPLDGGPSTLGRDQHMANLVFPQEADSISKRHCRIAWDAERRVFVLEDLGSTNGTFLASGERLSPGQPCDLRVGDRFYIGDLRNQFEVRMEE